MTSGPGPPTIRKDADGFLRRVGFGDGAPDSKLCWRILLAILLLYALSFALFYPRIATNIDEAMYLWQTRLVLTDSLSVVNEDALTGQTVEVWPATYSLGTAFLMTPFVATFGEGGGFVVPCIALLLAVLATARCLQQQGRSPLFALLLIGFPPALVMGRVAMSDAPSLAVVAVGLWLFWRGLERGWIWWLFAGFAAGASMAFRVSNAVVFLPLFAGTVLRRDSHWWALVVGGVAGLAIRFLSHGYYFGDMFYDRASYPFDPFGIGARIPLYLLGLLVFVPGGLVLGFAYRGRRRPEILTTLFLFIGFYLFQQFSMEETGLQKRLILGLRYFLPLLPIFAFAMAESAPRLWRRWLERRPREGQRVPAQVATAALITYVASVGFAAAAVHPAFALWSARQAEIRDAIDDVIDDDTVIVTNWAASQKFLRALERKYVPLRRSQSSLADLATVVERHGQVDIVFLDRSDSGWFRSDLAYNAAFIAAIEPAPELLVDQRVTATDHLRIWRVREMRLDGSAATRPADGGARL